MFLALSVLCMGPPMPVGCGGGGGNPTGKHMLPPASRQFSDRISIISRSLAKHMKNRLFHPHDNPCCCNCAVHIFKACLFFVVSIGSTQAVDCWKVEFRNLDALGILHTLYLGNTVALSDKLLLPLYVVQRTMCHVYAFLLDLNSWKQLFS